MYKNIYFNVQNTDMTYFLIEVVVYYPSMLRKKRIIIIASSIVGTITILAGTFFIYTSIYYHADQDRIDAYLTNRNVTITKLDNGDLKVSGEKEKAGIIMYPGAKVEYIAYEPLCASLAEHGYTSFIVQMPFNLAIFDVNAANGYIERYPDIKAWYMMGHSLGGSMASSYIAKHHDNYNGLILLGSYPDKSLVDFDTKLLSIYGSNDEVLDKTKYEEAKAKWPKKSQGYVIEGGCHAGFGMYGKQNNDGTPTITNEEQIELTTNSIAGYMNDIFLLEN